MTTDAAGSPCSRNRADEGDRSSGKKRTMLGRQVAPNRPPADGVDLRLHPQATLNLELAFVEG